MLLDKKKKKDQEMKTGISSEQDGSLGEHKLKQLTLILKGTSSRAVAQRVSLLLHQLF